MVDWPSSCLGVLVPETACADVVTPGYRILLKANDITYEFHTDKAGVNSILLDRVDGNSPISASSGVTNDLVLVWRREGGFAGFCDTVVVRKSGEYTVSYCRGRNSPLSQTAQMDATQAQQILEWAGRLKPFETSHVGPVHPDELIIEVTFYGTGNSDATSAEQKDIMAFGQQLRNTSK